MSKTIREAVEAFVYPHLEYFTSMVYENGEDTVFHGIRVLDDKEKFTQGALVNAASLLYAYYVRTNNAKSEEVLSRLHAFIKIAAATQCKTWGKLGILRGFNVLYENGLLDRVSKDCIELVKERTDYVDFFDKNTIETPGMATNYMQVAMACAGYREKLGWENDGYAKIIRDKLSRIISEQCENGWMDDEIPYGRYDRYSLVISSEFFDTAIDVGLELPENIKHNLKEAANVALFMANKRGDGVLFGRSVPCHGDCTGAEVLASALAAGLVENKSVPVALAYIMQIIRKLLDVWYDPDEKTFNMWWGGRATNYYRGTGRILEVNLDLANHLCTTLKNIERAGYADTEIDLTALSMPDAWKLYTVDFLVKNNNVKKVIFMRRKDLLISLPFVGHGKNWGRRSAYYAFPVIPATIEASAVADIPFFIPEYTTADGKKYRTCQHFNSVEIKDLNNGAIIVAKGNLASADTNTPERSDYCFEISYTLKSDSICVSFTSDVPAILTEMFTGKVSERAMISTYGFDASENVNTEGKDCFDGLHGKIFDAKRHTTLNNGNFGYEINFKDCF